MRHLKSKMEDRLEDAVKAGAGAQGGAWNLFGPEPIFRAPLEQRSFAALFCGGGQRMSLPPR